MTTTTRSISIVLLLAAVLTITGCTTISPGHAGIVIYNYGNQKGVQDFPVTTGFQWYNPATTDILEYPTYVQNVVWTKSVNEGNPVNEEITFTNKDSMVISADINLSYQLDRDKVPAFYVRFRSNDMPQFTNGFMRNVARDSINEVAGRYAVEEIMGDNAKFLKEARDLFQKQLEPFGINILQFGIIGAPRPPQSVIESINLKVQAQQIAMQKQNEVMQAQADANKQIALAEGHAKAALIEAEAQAKVNQQIAASVTPTLVQWEQIQRWDGKVPQVSGGSNSGFLYQIPSR